MTADRITVGPAAERDFAKWASETIAQQASEIAALRRRVATVESERDEARAKFSALAEKVAPPYVAPAQTLSPSPPAEERESGT